jgi:hypothetical protein
VLKTVIQLKTVLGCFIAKSDDDKKLYLLKVTSGEETGWGGMDNSFCGLIARADPDQGSCLQSQGF